MQVEAKATKSLKYSRHHTIPTPDPSPSTEETNVWDASDLALDQDPIQTGTSGTSTRGIRREREYSTISIMDFVTDGYLNKLDEREILFDSTADADKPGAKCLNDKCQKVMKGTDSKANWKSHATKCGLPKCFICIECRDLDRIQKLPYVPTFKDRQELKNHFEIKHPNKTFPTDKIQKKRKTVNITDDDVKKVLAGVMEPPAPE